MRRVICLGRFGCVSGSVTILSALACASAHFVKDIFMRLQLRYDALGTHPGRVGDTAAR